MPLATPEDVCNAALRDIAYPRPISDIYEGSRASRVALSVYGQARDELLREKDWRFARRTVALTLIKSADGLPIAPWDESRPIPPWRFAYAYPADAIIIRALRPDPQQYEGGESFNLYPIRFDIVTDYASLTTTTSQRLIMTDQENALANYTTRLTDLTQWEPLALAALIKSLANKFRPGLGMQQPASGDKQLQLTETAAVIDLADRRRG